MKITKTAAELLRGLLPEWEFETCVHGYAPNEVRSLMFCKPDDGSEWEDTYHPHWKDHLCAEIKRALPARGWKYAIHADKDGIAVAVWTPARYDCSKPAAEELEAWLDVLAQMEKKV